MSFESPKMEEPEQPITISAESVNTPDVSNEAISADQHISAESFLEQMKEPKLLEIDDESMSQCREITYTEIAPDKELPDEDVVIYVGGFGTNAHTYDQQLYEIANRGRRVLFVNPLEGLELPKEQEDYLNRHNIPKLMGKKVSEVLRLIDEKGLSNVDVVGHSQGGAVASIVTSLIPDKVGRLVLDCPAGLVGQQGRSEFIKRGFQEAGAEYSFAKEKLEAGNSAYFDAWKEEFIHPEKTDTSHLLWRLQKEVKSIGDTNIVPILEDIQQQINSDSGEQNHAPDVMLLTAQGDNIFKPEEIQETLGEAPFVEIGADGRRSGLINNWAMYADKETGHGFFTKHDPNLIPQMLEQGYYENDNAKNDQVRMIADYLQPLASNSDEKEHKFSEAA